MKVIVLQACGVVVFLVGSVWLAGGVRRRRSGRAAENASRISHALFWVALVLPGVIGFFHPGFAAYDALLGVPSLPPSFAWTIAGGVLVAGGAGLMAVSNRALFRKGRGAAAFVLTGRLVTDGLYGRTRNPMALGFYAAGLGVGLVAGSLAVTLAVLLVVVPVHVVNLKLFEERELARRFGAAYEDYRQRVPFLLPGFKRP